MNNRSRQWDPEYSAGPHFGDLVPMLQCRLRATYNAVTQYLFYGYVEAFNQEYPGYDADSYCELVVIDGFSVLANALLPDSVWRYTTDGFVNDTATYPGSFYYPLDEKHGQTMGDRGPNRYHGTYGAPIVSNQPGIVPYAGTGQALLFDGIDDVGAVPTNVFPAEPYTVGFWAKMPDEFEATYYRALVANNDTSTSNSSKSLVAYIDGPNVHSLVVYNAEMGPVHTLNPRWSNVPPDAGAIYHIVFTYANADPKLYINGELQTRTGSGFSSVTGFNPNTFLVGGSPVYMHGGGKSASFEVSTLTFLPWKGMLDEVVVLGAVLSAADVLAWYNSGAAPWDEDTSGERFTNVLDAIGWPASLRDLDTGDSVLGPATLSGSALAYLQLVEQTEQGRFYMTADGKVRLISRGALLSEATYSTSQATFGDSGSEMKYHDISVEPGNVQQVINSVTTIRQGGIEQKYEDATSAASYGVRSLHNSGLLMRSDGEAADLGWRIVTRYKDPGFRVTELTVMPRRDPSNLFPKVLGYELGTKITGVRRPQGVGSAISKEVHIEGIRHEIDWATQSFTTVWSTAPADPLEDSIAIVDSGVVGTHIVGY